MTVFARFNTPLNRIALVLWVLFMALLMVLTAWQLHASRMDATLRLQADAHRMAARAARILAVPAWEINEVSARSIVMSEMEDSRVYGMVVYDHLGFLEGQRRNENWECMPWDDLVPENMVEGTHSLTLEEQVVGAVHVYLSPRLLDEDMSALWWREMARFGITATVLCIFLMGILWIGRKQGD
ncbi:MAG: hypothetical protein RRY29_00525 [Desulfovibrionaceae bacterium]